MKLPSEVPVMTLPSVTLFPKALLPLYVFEPRYRRMLADVLQAQRMFAVAMQKPGRLREAPAPVAGLGLVRASVGHRDGTSHLVLQGLARVELERAVRYKPYRVQRIHVLESAPGDDVAVDALVGKVRELLAERLAADLPCPFPPLGKPEAGTPPAGSPAEIAKDLVAYVSDLKNPEHIADLVTCAVLRGAAQRQAILETLDVETRLRRLIRFLLAEMKQNKKVEHE
jgi:Lon protease-like protein